MTSKRVMQRATNRLPRDDARLDHPADAITLAWEDRHRRRIAMTTDGGERILLDLAQATRIGDGDGLLLDDGRVIVVRAAKEPVMRVTARDGAQLARIAWHIGNRHAPAQILPDAVHIQPDHVLADMVRRLGGAVCDITAAFEPEGGAYGPPDAADASQAGHVHHGAPRHHHGH